jgi:hypothetical protein
MGTRRAASCSHISTHRPCTHRAQPQGPPGVSGPRLRRTGWSIGRCPDHKRPTRDSLLTADSRWRGRRRIVHPDSYPGGYRRCRHCIACRLPCPGSCRFPCGSRTHRHPGIDPPGHYRPRDWLQRTFRPDSYQPACRRRHRCRLRPWVHSCRLACTPRRDSSLHNSWGTPAVGSGSRLGRRSGRLRSTFPRSTDLPRPRSSRCLCRDWPHSHCRRPRSSGTRRTGCSRPCRRHRSRTAPGPDTSSVRSRRRHPPDRRCCSRHSG